VCSSDLETHKLYGLYAQDHKPVVEQDEAVGHAVRAAYLYSGMADVAALTGDESYIKAIDKIWENVVFKKLYLTGGIGARHAGEAFGDNYELPNKSAYNETCAAIANGLWNYRMFLLHGEAKYLDVLERVIYNGFLSGVELSGDKFFYPNPLASDKGYKRSPWFGCACCPVNIVRFIPSIAGYVYAVKAGDVFVNLFIGGTGEVQADGRIVKIEQQTRYPWDGEVKIKVNPEKAAKFALNIRIPGWAQGKPVPGDLYSYIDQTVEHVVLKVNGRKEDLNLRNGFASIKRKWKKGDVVELSLPMPVRRVIANDALKDDAGLVAIERGPIVYCVEGVDNKHVFSMVLPDDVKLSVERRDDMLGGMMVIKGDVQMAVKDDSGKTVIKPAGLLAIPNYAWCNRGPAEMNIWFARSVEKAKPVPAPTIAGESNVTASHLWDHDTGAAVNDQILPKNSCDHDVPRFTWWDHKGTAEWIQYDFAKPCKVSSAQVFWFDDTGRGQCRIPESWKVLYKEGSSWKPVEGVSEYGVRKDLFNKVSFNAVETTGLRLDVQLQKNFSSGILEWNVE